MNILKEIKITIVKVPFHPIVYKKDVLGGTSILQVRKECKSYFWDKNNLCINV